MTGEKGLQVIGAGFSKTGTKTMHKVYEILGYGVNDSQENVYAHYKEWNQVWCGTKEDGRKAIRTLFGPGNKWGYDCTVDLPANALWQTLSDEFPEAKVVLVVRDDDRWINSLLNHIEVERKQFLEMWFHRQFGPLYRFVFNQSSDPIMTYMDFFRPMLIGPEDWRFSKSNADVLLSQYRAHNAAVKALVPKEKLLVYKIGEGWEPLCKFLGKPIPDVPFPHENRMGSVIEELTNDPHYIATMKRQFLGWGLRTLMLIGAFMAYRNPTLLPDCMEQGPYQFSLADNFWPTCGYLLAFFYFFKIA